MTEEFVAGSVLTMDNAITKKVFDVHPPAISDRGGLMSGRSSRSSLYSAQYASCEAADIPDLAHLDLGEAKRSSRTMSWTSERGSSFSERSTLHSARGCPPSNINGHKQKGDDFSKQGDFEEALRHYTCAIELGEDTHTIRSNRSACFHQAGLYYEALHDARIAILRAPHWSKGYCRKAAAHIALGEYEEAYEEYSIALNLEPEDVLIRNALAEVSAQLDSGPGRSRAINICNMHRISADRGTLNLSNAGLGDDGAIVLCDSLAPGVRRLWLDGNSLTDVGAAAIARLVDRNRDLSFLSLDRNQIGDGGAAELAAALARHHALRQVQLAANRIGPIGAEALAAALEENPRIARVALAQNPVCAGALRDDSPPPEDGHCAGAGSLAALGCGARTAPTAEDPAPAGLLSYFRFCSGGSGRKARPRAAAAPPPQPPPPQPPASPYKPLSGLWMHRYYTGLDLPAE
jgi:tetratricopeptide (TPR) repeat protein